MQINRAKGLSIMGRPALKLDMTPDERLELEAVSRSHTLPDAVVRRAKILLLAINGLPATAIAARFGISPPAVTHWKKRYASIGLRGLQDCAAQSTQAAP